MPHGPQLINEYLPEGEVTLLRIISRNELRATVLLDTADVEKAKLFIWRDQGGYILDRTNAKALTALIMEPPDGHGTEYVNGNTHDLRRANLRLIRRGKRGPKRGAAASGAKQTKRNYSRTVKAPVTVQTYKPVAPLGWENGLPVYEDADMVGDAELESLLGDMPRDTPSNTVPLSSVAALADESQNVLTIPIKFPIELNHSTLADVLRVLKPGIGRLKLIAE